MPTGFRERPINYATTEKFKDSICELQFFGVSGYEVETLFVEGTNSYDDEKMMIHPGLNLPIEMRISQTCAADS